VDVVTLALGTLGGAERPVHLEVIAMRAFKISPGAFRWDLEEYANYIDKDKVRVSLTDAQKEKYGARVRAVGAKRGGISKPTDAWQLTPSGTAWYRENRDPVASEPEGRQSSLKKGKATALRKRLENSELYEAFKTTGQVEEDAFAFTDLLECSPDANNQVVQAKLDILMNQVGLLGDQALAEFLDACAAAHQDMLMEVEGRER